MLHRGSLMEMFNYMRSPWLYLTTVCKFQVPWSLLCRKYINLNFQFVILHYTMIQSYLVGKKKTKSIPMNFSVLRLSSTLGDVLIHMYFSTWANRERFLCSEFQMFSWSLPAAILVATWCLHSNSIKQPRSQGLSDNGDPGKEVVYKVAWFQCFDK